MNSTDDDSGRSLSELLAMSGPPAFMRRAAEVENVLEQLLHHCSTERERLLSMSRMRLATLEALCGEWSVLAPDLADEDQLALIVTLHDEWRPTLRGTVAATTSRRVIRGALADLCESFAAFNDRWARFVAALDLSRINDLREGYNRWYLLEKECLFRSPRTAREGFVKLPPLTTNDVLMRFPPLSVPLLSR